MYLILDCTCVSRQVQSFCRRTPTDLWQDTRLSATEKATSWGLMARFCPTQWNCLRQFAPWHARNWPRPLRSSQVTVKERNSAVCFYMKIRLTLLRMLTLLYVNWYTLTCFSLHGGVLRHYWYISWAQSNKYMYRCIRLDSSIFYVTWLRQMAT